MSVPTLFFKYHENDVPPSGSVVVPPPSTGLSKNVNFVTRQAEFGDGYVQRFADGLNSRRVNWRIVWNNMDADDAIELMNFLDSLGGTRVFRFNTLRSAVDKNRKRAKGESSLSLTEDGDNGGFVNVICASYEASPQTADLYSITMDVNKVFDLV